MDENLLDEDLEEMRPYLMKWHREYFIMFLTSSYETLNYEVTMQGLAPVKDMLCQDYLYSISEAFRELVKTYYYAQAAYKIEKELKEKGEIGWSNYWKFEMKNYHFRTVIPRIISLLDYVAVMINELSQCEIIKIEKNVYFNSFKSLLRKHNQKAGWLSFEEIKELNRILESAYKDIRPEERKILRNYRNTSTHRYFVGIDELSVPFQRRKLTKKDQKRLNTQQNYSYGMRGKPEYSYDKLNSTAEKMLNNLDVMLSQLIKMDMMQSAVTPIEKNK